MSSRAEEHEAWNLARGLKPNEKLQLVCPRCEQPHTETLTNDPSEPDYYHHVHQCTVCGIRFDLFVRTRSVQPDVVRLKEMLRRSRDKLAVAGDMSGLSYKKFIAEIDKLLES